MMSPLPDVAIWSLLISAKGCAVVPAFIFIRLWFCHLAAHAVRAGINRFAVAAQEQAIALLAVASVGNTLGSMLNWWLGLNILRLQHYRWFPIKEAQLEKAQRTYGKYGYWSLLLSWVPVVGDPLTLIAGVMKEPLWRFVLIVALAKTARYAVVVIIV